MGLKKPYRRTCRPFADGDYTEGGRWLYLLHKKYATDPRHYVRAFLLIQADVLDMFSYVEPSDANLQTYSHRIQQLLMRACVEIEANFTAILLDNEYPRAKANANLNIYDYQRINRSHRLSSFVVSVPGWKGAAGSRRPFEAWERERPLTWYQAYNKSKHNRHDNFHLATFDALIDAYCGLNAVLSAQFYDEDYSAGSKAITVGGDCYAYDKDGMRPAIGNMLRICSPNDWPLQDRYDFDWDDLDSSEEDPFVNFDYMKLLGE